MKEAIVVTGIGVITPYGVGLEILWEKLLAGESAIHELAAEEVNHVQCRVGGQLMGFQTQKWLSPRIARKLDRFSQFGLITAQEALKDAGLTPADFDHSVSEDVPEWDKACGGRDQIGIAVGNNLGGWEFAERELRHLWRNGPREVSPYMATAWFPAAVQGTISIQLGIKGIGRTFLCDRASSAYAIAHAANCLRRGYASLMFAGGSEAPFSPYAALCYQTTGLMSTRQIYAPFDQRHDGLIAGEGAAFLILERASDAQKRGAPIYAEVAGWATTHDGYSMKEAAPDGRRYAQAISRALEKAEVSAKDVDCIFAAGSAVPGEDVSEVRAIKGALGRDANTIPVSVPKAGFGNLFGAASAVDLVIALLAMQQKCIPMTQNLRQPAPECELDYVVGVPREVGRLDVAMVLSRGLGGANACLILKRW